MTSANAMVNATIRVDGDHYAQGRNTFLVDFDPGKTVLEKATGFMPVHGHGTPTPPTVEQSDTGYRITNFIFSMPGLWDVTLDVTLDGKSDKIEFSLDVP